MTETIGKRGETLAARYLERQGFVILESNARIGHKEVDIIARDGDEVVFVEVKTRTGDSHGTAAEAVTSHKLSHLITALEAYLLRHPEVSSARIDVIAITVTSIGKARLQHYRNVSIS